MVGVYDLSLLRDGFAGDQGLSDRFILPAINQALAVMAQAGFTRADFSTTTTSGTYEYPLNVAESFIIDVTYTDNGGNRKPLKPVEMVDLNNRNANWRNVPPRTPNVFITDGATILLWPIPNGVGPMIIRAYQTPPDLVSSTDVPAYLPDIYHDALAILGALLLILGGAVADPAEETGRKSGVMAAWALQDGALTRAINTRTIVSDATRQEGGNG